MNTLIQFILNLAFLADHFSFLCLERGDRERPSWRLNTHEILLRADASQTLPESLEVSWESAAEIPCTINDRDRDRPHNKRN
eukprot:SAG11_NODE_1110_length_5824_cov_7.340087_2_plen_82_part_00